MTFSSYDAVGVIMLLPPALAGLVSFGGHTTVLTKPYQEIMELQLETAIQAVEADFNKSGEVVETLGQMLKSLEEDIAKAEAISKKSYSQAINIGLSALMTQETLYKRIYERLFNYKRDYA